MNFRRRLANRCIRNLCQAHVLDTERKPQRCAKNRRKATRAFGKRDHDRTFPSFGRAARSIYLIPIHCRAITEAVIDTKGCRHSGTYGRGSAGVFGGCVRQTVDVSLGLLLPVSRSSPRKASVRADGLSWQRPRRHAIGLSSLSCIKGSPLTVTLS